MNKGDTIKCYDAEDAINAMYDLEMAGITTDIIYEKDGKKGIWLEVVHVVGGANGENKDNASARI